MLSCDSDRCRAAQLAHITACALRQYFLHLICADSVLREPAGAALAGSFTGMPSPPAPAGKASAGVAEVLSEAEFERWLREDLPRNLTEEALDYDQPHPSVACLPTIRVSKRSPQFQSGAHACFQLATSIHA